MSTNTYRSPPESVGAHPFRLRRIELENFKSVELASVDLGPLSVLVGANSSGKSTLLQVALAACQAISDGNSATEFSLNGTLQNLGTYEDIHNFRSSDSNEPIRFEFQFAEPCESEDKETTQKTSNTGPYTVEWSMNLVDGTTRQTGTCQIDSQRVEISSFRGSEEVVDHLISPSETSQEKDREIFNPLFCSFVRVRSRGEYCAGIWWDALEDYLSLDESKEAAKTKEYSKYEYQNILSMLGIDDPEEMLASVAISDLTQARHLIEEPSSVSCDVADGSTLLSQGLPKWLFNHFRRPLDEWGEDIITQFEPFFGQSTQDPDVEHRSRPLRVVLALLFGSSNRGTLQSLVRHELQNDSWWGEGVLSEIPDSGTYLWRDEDGWNDDWTALGVVNDILGEWFGSKLSYLGPLRRSPQDHPSSGPRPRKDLGTSGEYAEAVLNSQAGKEVCVPLPDGYERELPLGQALDSWLEWFGLADDAKVVDRGRGIELNVRPPGGSKSVYLSSVGVGVSQVLPVILLCLLSKPAEMLILEQPELHLHPALQKRLADFLLVFVRAGRQILVETHSDHLVNQLRYQVASDGTDEIRNLVKLIFAEQTDGITTYRESEINEYGGLSEDWPDGFLDISARSAQDLVRQSLRKMKVRRPEPAEAN